MDFKLGGADSETSAGFSGNKFMVVADGCCAMVEAGLPFEFASTVHVIPRDRSPKLPFSFKYWLNKLQVRVKLGFSADFWPENPDEDDIFTSEIETDRFPEQRRGKLELNMNLFGFQRRGVIYWKRKETI